MLIYTSKSTTNPTPQIKPEEIKHQKSVEKLNRQLFPKRKYSFCSYQPPLTKLIITPLTPFISTQSDVSNQSSDGVVSIQDKPKTAYEDVQFIKNNMFAVISNLLIIDGFTNYNYRIVTYDKFIYLVKNDNTKDMDDDGEFLWDKIEEDVIFDFLFKISTDLEVPELHINWKISVYLFKLLLNILDKMKVKLYFIVDLEYLLNKENDFEEILKELDYKLNFKIYSESIVYKFINNIKDKITNEQLNLFNEIYTLIFNYWDIFILN